MSDEPSPSRGAPDASPTTEADEKFRKAFQSSPGSMSISTLHEGRFVEVNERFLSLFGYEPEDVLGRSAGDLKLWWDPTQRNLMVRELVRRGRLRDWQVEVRTRAGERRVARLSAELIELAGDRHVLCVTEDVTERLRLAEEVRVMRDQLLRGAFHDPLTGLPNRALFLDRLGRAVARRRRHPDYTLAALVVDLDGFKTVNDSLGSEAGDELLAAVARRLEQCVRPEDTVARAGGDEFVVLVEDLAGPCDATAVAERLLHSFDACFELSGWQLFASASIGIAVPGPRVDPTQLLREAYTALHRAKTHGRATYAVYDITMHEHAMARLRLETELRGAVDRGEFELYYQPIVAIASGAVTGLEALVRWRHRDRGLLQPASFIPVAEETGTIVAIGSWVLSEACGQVRAWQAEHARPDLTLSVNVSARQLAGDSLVDAVRTATSETGLDPHGLILEITESTLIHDSAPALQALRALRELGVRVSLDDFGTGYSPLTYLRRYPVDVLKIDRAFVSRMDRDRMSREIVRALVTLARRVGLRVVAEGVQNVAQAKYLASVSCENAQGFLFAPPLPVRNVPAILRRGAFSGR